MRTAAWGLGFLIIVLPLVLVHTAENPFPLCSTSTYRADSTYQHNLQSLLAFLVANASITGYYNATVGTGGDQVQGLLQCRGDLDGEVCQICASEAASRIAETCLYRMEGLVAYHLCILYYYDANFTIPKFITNFALPNPSAIPDPQQFKPMLSSFFHGLVVSATTNPSGRLFWGDKFRYAGHGVTVYGTVECSQYLLPEQCRSCLEEGIARMLKDYADRRGAAVYTRAQCYIRYDTFPFFTPLVPTLALSSARYISKKCSAASNNMTGTSYHRNLKALLLYLTENGPLTGFFNQTIGQGADQVFGEVLCQGDVSDDVCWNCTAQASAMILRLCPNSKQAIIWLQHCQLRYSDRNLQGTMDVGDSACQPDPENAPSPTSNFDQTLSDLISYLAFNVSQGSSGGLMFATGAAIIAKSQRNLYALVQCNRDISADQCGRCLRSAASDIAGCSKGKQGARIFKGSCRLAYGLQRFFLAQPMLMLPGKRDRKPWWNMFLVLSLISLVLLAAACALCLLRIRRRHIAKLNHNIEADDHDAGNATEEAEYDLTQISLRAIEEATNNFSEANKLGEGGFGPVYKGKLPDGQEVAVKRMARASGQGVREFKNEVKLIAKLQHTNLVRLIGCCLEKREKLLVYEYMSNGSLDYFLKDPEHSVLLDWERRFNIIMGIARGTLYLHQDSRLNVVHRDLKAGNVLLDGQMNPKISDFGMARVFTGVHGQATTSVVVGTYGYMAPEYALDGMFSTKSDVYSFGILLLEIIGGQLNSKFQLSHPDKNLITHAWRLWSEGNSSEFIDPILIRSTSSINEMQRCTQIGLLCIQEDAATRPAMSTVVLMLANNSLLLPLPKPPAYSQISTS
ncbi:cysteine-rich receptor-like protein kinase 15 [Nymphaea colorata]|nr:cysteine-rich receptor-like protein kinase 15 [Nymphaea colorata]